MSNEPLRWVEPVVGVTFRPDYPDHLQDIVQGEEVVLEREPDNSFDENAIKVVVGRQTLPDIFAGYVGRDRAAQLAPVMDEPAYVVTAVVHEVKSYDDAVAGFDVEITVTAP